MQIYLPIAELSLNVFFLVGIGGAVGFLSGLFGVGGGFLLTPLLIFAGVPSPVAVASVTGQVAAASTSGALSYWRRGGIDTHLAMYLVLSGVIGVQTLLTRLGYEVGTADGFAGPRTAEAIKAFERATGMSETGQINPRLLAVLASQPV